MGEVTPRAFKDGRAFVVKFADAYIRFGSYRTGFKKADPFKANLYARRSEAEKRVEGGVWVDGQRQDGLTGLKVVEIEVTWKEVGE